MSRRLKRPLDRDAVKAANEKLWADNPELKGRKLTMAPEDYEYRNQWVAAYVAAKGKVEDPKPHAPPKRPHQPCNCKPHLKAKIASLKFDSDHGLLTDKNDDWRKGGHLFEAKDKREWTRKHSFPISHTKNERIALTAEFDCSPAASPPDQGRVLGHGGSSSLKFPGTASFAPGKVSVALNSDGRLPDKVVKLSNQTIKWTVSFTQSSSEAGTTGKHTIYVTLDKPRNEGKQEDGVTLKRMDKAVELVSQAKSNDPHTIVTHLMKLFPYYTLRRSPAVPKKYKHPTYFNKLGGAWPMADYVTKYAECQAIVRFVRGVIKQVGCPGKAETVIVWADPDVDGGKKALENLWESGGGLGKKSKIVGGKVWYAALADRNPIKVGQKFRPKEMGLNNFEACLRFTHNGAKKYYGGGAGIYDSAQQVLPAFFALVWVTFDTNAAGNEIYTIQEIVRRYR